MNKEQEQTIEKQSLAKKPYRSPNLVQYGDIAKLTSTNPNTGPGDGLGKMSPS